MGAGEGLHARVELPPGTTACFYNGVRLPESEEDGEVDWEECSYRIFLNTTGETKDCDRQDIR